MMWHCCVKISYRAVNVTRTSRSTVHHSCPKENICKGLYKHSLFIQQLAHFNKVGCLGRPAPKELPVELSEVKFTRKNNVKTAAKLCTELGSHGFELTWCFNAGDPLDSRFEKSTSTNSSIIVPLCPDVQSEGTCVHLSVPDILHISFAQTGGITTGFLTDDFPCDRWTCALEGRNKSTKKGITVTLPEPKSPIHATNKCSRPLLLLMRCSINFQYRCRVRKSRLGSHRKAKDLTRISTLRGKRLKAEVLRYLSSPSTESKDLTREVNGEVLLKLKSRGWTRLGWDGVGPLGRTMVQDSSVTEALLPAQETGDGRTSKRKRTPKSCDCCGPNCKPQLGKVHTAERPGFRNQGTGKRGRKKKMTTTAAAAAAAGAEQVTLSENVDAASLDGACIPESHTADRGAEMEVEPAVSGLDDGTNPLLDHRYCKMETEYSDTDKENSETKGDSLPVSQLLTTDISDEGITDLIHEFLELFYEKYGSFIALRDSDVLEHLNKQLNKDLTDRKSFICAEVTKYQAGLASSPVHYFKVAYNKHTLTLEDLSTLDDQNWVNDQVINMYGELIMEAANQKVHFFNSFFHRQLVAKGYEGVKRWTKKVDLFTKTLLLIPIHLEIHWSLITVDITNQHIHFYDSQGIVFKHAIENILRYILAEAKEKQHAVYQKGWKMIVNKCIPQQKNDSDCGVFVLEYCKCLALKEPLQFTQEDMPMVRKRIYKELCECKLMD